MKSRAPKLAWGDQCFAVRKAASAVKPQLQLPCLAHAVQMMGEGPQSHPSSLVQKSELAMARALGAKQEASIGKNGL